MQFNKVYKEANETKARYKVLTGSAGSGKSVNVAQDYIIKLMNPIYKGCSLLVVRSAEVSHLNSTFAELQRAILDLGMYHLWKITVNPLAMKCLATGNEIIFRGCNDQRSIERLKSVNTSSGKITWVWIEEATELRHTDFEIIDDRLRGELPKGQFYQITLTFNPINVHHWIKRYLWDYKSKDIYTLKTTYLDNKFIDEAYAQRMKRRQEVDPEGYQIYGLGEWGEVGGLIFSNYKIGDYKGREFDSFTIGADWGFNHNTAITLIGWYDGEPYIIDEVVANQKTTNEIIDLCENANIPKNVMMYADSAEPDRINEFKSAGYRIVPVSKETNSIKNQIEFLRNRTIYIDGRCTNMVREIQQYKYTKDRTTGEFTDEPLSIEDDSIASLRYGIEPYRKSKKLRTMKKGGLF